jgi:hypothetical protein
MVAWRSASRLDSLIARPGFAAGVTEVAAELEWAVEDVRIAIDEMRAGQVRIDHYE